jgi:hypothetical protein
MARNLIPLAAIALFALTCVYPIALFNLRDLVAVLSSRRSQACCRDGGLSRESSDPLSAAISDLLADRWFAFSSLLTICEVTHLCCGRLAFELPNLPWSRI